MKWAWFSCVWAGCLRAWLSEGEVLRKEAELQWGGSFWGVAMKTWACPKVRRLIVRGRGYKELGVARFGGRGYVRAWLAGAELKEGRAQALSWEQGPKCWEGWIWGAWGSFCGRCI